MDRYTSPERLTEQYSDSERLRIRQETHRRYSENPVSFLAWATEQMDIRPGMIVVDVGCGRGIYHPLFRERGATVVGIDRSIGMVREAGSGCLAVVGDAQALPLLMRLVTGRCATTSCITSPTSSSRCASFGESCGRAVGW